MLQKNIIGFLLTPGFQPADVIGLDAVLGMYPRNTVYYISEHETVVYGKSNFGIKATASFVNCPALDVLVVGGMRSESTKDKKVLNFLVKYSPKAKYVIAVSNGVLALYHSGVIRNQNVTSDQSTLKALRNSSLSLINEKRCIVDGKYITAGPSTGGIEAAFTVINKTRGKWLTRFLEFNLEYDALVQYPVNEGFVLKQPDLPKALKVGVFIPDDLYIPDIMGAMDAFACLPNCEMFFVSKEKKLSKSISGIGPEIMPDTSFEDCPPLDVLIIGASHPRYITDVETLEFVLKQETSAQAIISVCAGTFVVGSAGLLEGKKATTNYHQIKDLNRIGAYYTGKEVEVDGKYFSAGPAVGSYEVGLKAIEKIIGKAWAQYIEQVMLEFAPNPVFGTNPEHVSPSILRVTNFLSIFLRRIYRPYIKKGYYGKKMKNNKASFEK